MMAEKQKNRGIHERYRNVLTLLDRILKLFESVRLEPELLTTYKQLLHYLRTRPDGEISIILRTHQRAKASPREDNARNLSDDEIKLLTAEEVRRQISESKVPRIHLERIASIRFGVTRGALSNLRSRDALIEKILTLIGHEGTHESIARAVNARNEE